MSNEHPILFSTPMVQAIMEGRKTQTRRTKGLEKLNTQPSHYKYIGNSKKNDNIAFPAEGYNARPWFAFQINISNAYDFIFQCPYGKVGDILWVRETFNYRDREKMNVAYKADKDKQAQHFLPWKPSIHMPKAAARIWLEITDVRVERLHDISEADAKAEGTGTANFLEPKPQHFFWLWESINGKGSLESNHWVWVVEFKVVSTNGRPKV